MGVMDKRLEIVVSHRAWMAWHSGIVAYMHEGKPCPISTLPIPYPDFRGPLIGTKSFFSALRTVLLGGALAGATTEGAGHPAQRSWAGPSASAGVSLSPFMQCILASVYLIWHLKEGQKQGEE